MPAQPRMLLVFALLCAGCPREPIGPLEDPGIPATVADTISSEDADPRVDPSRCTGDGLDLLALVEASPCTITLADAAALPDVELLEIEVPGKLRVAAGGRLEFELLLHNRSGEELDLDLAFGRFLPLSPVHTERLGKLKAKDKGKGIDQSCILQAMSTEPPPERVTLPPGAELAIPCQWYANTRLIDPESYVGSECPDFPPLASGRYRSVFVVGGGGGSARELRVEIEVR